MNRATVKPLPQRDHPDKAAKGGDGVFESQVEGQPNLRELLANKPVLLAVDDAWRGGDVEAFNVLGPHSPHTTPGCSIRCILTRQQQ